MLTIILLKALGRRRQGEERAGVWMKFFCNETFVLSRQLNFNSGHI